MPSISRRLPPADRHSLAEVEYRLDRVSARSGHRQRGADRHRAITRNFELRLVQLNSVREDFGEDRQRVDAGIEDAEAAVLPDPALPRVPVAHVFLPLDPDRADGGLREPFRGRPDRRRGA
jgi:hypothetical protein